MVHNTLNPLTAAPDWHNLPLPRAPSVVCICFSSAYIAKTINARVMGEVSYESTNLPLPFGTNGKSSLTFTAAAVTAEVRWWNPGVFQEKTSARCLEVPSTASLNTQYHFTMYNSAHWHFTVTVSHCTPLILAQTDGSAIYLHYLHIHELFSIIFQYIANDILHCHCQSLPVALHSLMRAPVDGSPIYLHCL